METILKGNFKKNDSKKSSIFSKKTHILKISNKKKKQTSSMIKKLYLEFTNKLEKINMIFEGIFFIKVISPVRVLSCYDLADLDINRNID